MRREQLIRNIKTKGTYLCVGLDTDIVKMPSKEDIASALHLEPIMVSSVQKQMFHFNRGIIDKTHQHCVAYKPNYWFYAAHGSRGIRALELTIDYLRKNHPEHLVILDFKGGDIGNTAKMMARMAFDFMEVDAVTLNPYMGLDVAEPFLAYEDKWIILLALTSNNGAKDFQFINTGDMIATGKLYQQVLFKSSNWGDPDNTMYVIGATKPEELGEIRKRYPDHFFLVPGVGAQGGSLEEVSEKGFNDDCGLLVNSSRKILYARKDEGFAQAAGEVAKGYHDEMREALKKYPKPQQKI